MPDKKLTDSEIKEVLDMVKAKTDQYCQECPYDDIEVCNICIFGKMKIVIDLINCLQARIGVYETCNARKDEAIKHLESEVKRLQAENERLSKAVNRLTNRVCDLKEKDETRHKVFMTKCEELETAKAEAYKEFAERLKENSIATFSFKGVVMVEEIDNLLKEMVGE